MSAHPSQRVQRVKPSPTLSVAARAAELRAADHDIISLSAGETDFDTPEHIKDAARHAIANGQTRYTAVDGTPELKRAIIDKFKRDNQLDYQANQILVSCGGKQSFFNLALALLDKDDEVIIPAPYWVSYPDIVMIADAVPVIVETDMAAGFKMTPEQLEAAITSKTRLVVLNSPSNPTGTTYSRSELQALGKVLLKHPRIMVASDDIYEHMLWRQEPFCNILMACPELYERAIVLNGVSKAYSMTGWRIGYAGGPEWLIRNMKKIQSQSTSNPCSIAQAAAVAALSGPQDSISTMVTDFIQRHAYVIKRLRQLPGVRVLESDGTFYSFPDFNEAIKRLGYRNDTDFAEMLLEKGVALVPGSAFGAEGYMRLSFTASQAALEQALDRLENVLNKS